MARSRPSIAPIVLLQVRRLGLGFPGLLFLAGLGLLRWNWGAPAGYGGLQDAPLLRLSWALQQGAWLWVLLVGLQLGSQVRRLQRKEANWLAPLGIGPGAYVAAVWLGTMLASALAMLILLAALVGTQTVHAPPHAIDRVLSWKTDASLAPGQALQDDWEAGTSDRLALLVRPTVGAAPTTAAQLTASKGTVGKQSEARVEGLMWLTVAIPAGPDPLRVTLANQGAGQLGVLGTRSLLTLSEQGAVSHWFRLGLRAWLWAGWLFALILTACAWLRPALGIPLALLAGLGLVHLGWTGFAEWPEALDWQRVSMGTTALPLWMGGSIPLWLATCWLLARRGLRAWGIDR
jgi:hypothetical protein